MIRTCLLFCIAASALSGQARAAVAVHVRGDSTIVAEVAAWRPLEQVPLVFPDGSDRLIGVHKILKIVDADGADRTRFVLDGRGMIGSYPETYRGSRKAQSVSLKPIGVVAGAAAAAGVVVALAFLLELGQASDY